ncbi:MAG: hypothetical protein LBN32_04495 [Helicobacteraceae bacterium]|nr:hypothetical protein [Helicobacteraceae bacterium]
MDKIAGVICGNVRYVPANPEKENTMTSLGIGLLVISAVALVINHYAKRDKTAKRSKK